MQLTPRSWLFIEAKARSLSRLCDLAASATELSVRGRDQKLTLENVIDFMSFHESDPHVKEVMGDLAELLLMFEDIQEIEVESKKPASGKLVFGGGSSEGTRMELRMTKEQFDNIVSKVASLRADIVGTES